MAACADETEKSPSKNPPIRVISLPDAKEKVVEDKKHSSAILLGLHQNYKDEKFCDVTLVFGDKEIKAHKVVLASSSRYFEAMFSSNFIDGSQQKLEIPLFDSKIGTALIDYAYTGKVEITADNVVEILAGANFLQGFDFVEKSCCDYLKFHMSDENALQILQVADQFHQSKLKDHIKKYCFLRFSTFAENKAFLNIPFKLLKEVLSDDHLLVEKNGVVYLGRRQEEYLLEKVLEYIKHNEEVNEKAEQLLKCIHLPLLKNKKLHALKSNDVLQSTECKALIDEALLLKKEKTSKSAQLQEEETDELSQKDWTKPRPCGEYQLWRGRCLANGEQVNDEAVAFSDKEKINVHSDYVTGMDLWIRSWDGRPVIGGMKIYYSNGESCMHGDEKGSTKEEFRLDTDERIIKLDSQSGYMIDCVTFFTNKERKLGPHGGSGGGYRQENPPNYHGYLVCVEGNVVKSQGSLGITKLQFLWRFFRTHDQSHVPDYIEAYYDEFDEDDYDDFYDDYEDYDDYEGYDFEDDYDIEDENFYDYDPTPDDDFWP
ncbi:actin-binding protein IPP-like [Actinia tenebrosa]|uniref:Actin-binding protein IPP-like n=1 Tax=Actinia tenebrosa TaxID=6105 RepID=A0A6P8IM03_ACTTE|nr:actin-binding protein IPP-like [Actinia tenebrosa]